MCYQISHVPNWRCGVGNPKKSKVLFAIPGMEYFGSYSPLHHTDFRPERNVPLQIVLLGTYHFEDVGGDEEGDDDDRNYLVAETRHFELLISCKIKT